MSTAAGSRERQLVGAPLDLLLDPIGPAVAGVALDAEQDRGAGRLCRLQHRRELAGVHRIDPIVVIGRVEQHSRVGAAAGVDRDAVRRVP